MTTYPAADATGYQEIAFALEKEETKLTRTFPRKPFVPSGKEEREKRCDEILTIQAMGLKKRLEHTHSQSAVIGISGGLDSTLALLVQPEHLISSACREKRSPQLRCRVSEPQTERIGMPATLRKNWGQHCGK